MRKNLSNSIKLMLLLSFMSVAASAQYVSNGIKTVPVGTSANLTLASIGQNALTTTANASFVNRENPSLFNMGSYNLLPEKEDKAESPVVDASVDSMKVTVYDKMIAKRHIQRVDRSDMKEVFIPKGLVMVGALVNYHEWSNEDQTLLVLKNFNFKGHVLTVSPALAYFVSDNLAVGGRYSYNRNYFDMPSLDLNLGEDFNINLEDLYYLEHEHEGSLFMRYYMPLFGSKVFGAFTEVRATYSRTNGKNSTGRRDLEYGINTLDATYGNSNMVQLGVTPGLCIFVTDFAAVETSIGVFGINYKWSSHKNLHPNASEYEYGKNHSGGANFKFNLFSVNIGLTFYL